MIRSIKYLAAAGILAAFAGGAKAAPANLGAGTGVTDGLVKVHGDHRQCERGRNGWHRHNRNGERRECRRWQGEGQRRLRDRIFRERLYYDPAIFTA
jgi:hypothetical protein